MATIYNPADKTAAEWRELASDCTRRSQESWERSDTDGFLSQWASDSMSRMYSSLATLAEQGNVADFEVLADLDGNELDARQVEGKYGLVWLVRNPDGSVSWFNESSAKNEATRRRNNAKKGYQFVTVTKPALAKFGNGMMPGVVWFPAEEA